MRFLISIFADRACRELKQQSPLRYVMPVAWAVLILVGLELVLEKRAADRGYATILFQPQGVSLRDEDTQRHVVAAPAFGPTADFPFRSRVISPEKPEGVIRIWIASASYAEDVRTPVERIFPNLLEKELVDRGIACQVINASRAGSPLANNYHDLQTLARTWQPDVVVVYQMSMDMASLFKQSQMTKSLQQPSGLGAELKKELRRLSESTTTYELLKSNISSRINSAAVLADQLPESATAEFFDSLEDLVELASAMNAKTYVCTFCYSHPDGQVPTEFELGLLKTVPGLSPAAWAATFRQWNNGIREQTDRHRIVDLDRALSGMTELFRDPVHFSIAGHQRVADELAASLATSFSEPDGGLLP